MKAWAKNVWTWLTTHTWALWTMAGVALVVIARVVFHAVRPVDALDAERARLEWEREAAVQERNRIQLDLRRAELVREAARKARARAELEGRSTVLVQETAEELERIQTMDAEELAAEWERLRKSEEDTRRSRP